MKTCSICKEEKPFTEFGKYKNSKDGLKPACKVCLAVSSKKYREDNAEECKKRNKKWCDDNPEYFKAYHEANAEKAKERMTEWRDANPGYGKNRHDDNPEYSKEYYEANKEQSREDGKRFREANPEYSKQYRESNREKIRDRHNNKLASDIGYKLRINLRVRLRRALKGKQKVGSAVRDLGCTGQFLADYLESLWTVGMNWENYGKGLDSWNIDHIVPLSAFNLEVPQHVLLACYYLNLRPLWHVENMRKGDKLPWELAKAA